MDPRERSPPASRPARRILKPQRRIDFDIEDTPVRSLWKEKIKQEIAKKENKNKPEVDALQHALESMNISPKAKKAKYQGGWYNIHVGERGGKYIVVQGQKKYLPRDTKP